MIIPMNSDIKIIFSDIDWTLLNHGHEKHEFDYESIEALKRVQSSGVKVFLCTARPYHSVKGTGLLDLIKPDGIVCTNGAVAFVGDTVIHNNCFPKETVKEIIKVANRHHLCIELKNEKDRWLTKPGNKYVDSYFAVFHEVYPEIRKYNNENISAILLLAPEKYDEVLKKEFPEGITGFRFSDCGVDVHYKPVYKSEGVNAVLNYLNINKDNAMALGDDYGDIEMFQAVKYSICMENGREEAKAVAYDITPHIDEHGVALAMKKYFNV